MMHGGRHRVLIGRENVVGLRVVTVGVARPVMAPPVGSRHGERFGGQDIVSRLAMKLAITLAHGEGLGGQDVVRLVGIALASHGP